MLNRDRAARVRENMKKAGLDQIVVSSTESVFYLTGIYVRPMERLLALYLTADGEAALYANEIFGLESTPDLPVVTHKDGEDAVRDLAKAVRPGTLGIDKFLYSKFLIALMSARADVKPACSCRLSCLAVRVWAPFLKVFTSFCPRSRLVRMKRAGTKKSNSRRSDYRDRPGERIRQAISPMAWRAARLMPPS